MPSNLAVYPPAVALPSASTSSWVSLMPSGAGSNFRVAPLGVGPGLYLDFATLSFQVPTQLSPARASEAEMI